MTITDQKGALKSELRIAVVDDAFALPYWDSVQMNHIESFCDAVAEKDMSERLSEITGGDFADPSAVSDEQLAALYESRSRCDEVSTELNLIFADYERRKEDLEKIIAKLEDHGFQVDTFATEDGLFSGGTYSLVFLDLYMKHGDETIAESIAKRIYKDFRAFIFLMSDIPGASEREEDFRRRTRLLKGFFHFCKKADLCDEKLLELQLNSLPSDPTICHAIHDFVSAIEFALGGNIEEPEDLNIGSADSNPAPGRALSQFMKTFRTLGLQDYAVLCELTLRDEGHPLGDYLIRLLGGYLIEQVLKQDEVRSCVRNLDRMRFTEFLPFKADTSDSLKELYAASLVESVSSPWAAHPWDSDEAGIRDSEPNGD